MKKVININFQGRVVMIEEDAYENLKAYIDSLRRHFANEEGHEEIINDIESRISELFEEVIKQGKPCVSEGDLMGIIHSIGRPEDFVEDDLADAGAPEGTSASRQRAATASSTEEKTAENNKEQDPRDGQSHGQGHRHKQLFRDENNKRLGGVCSGIANFFGIDPTIVRLITLILFFTYGIGVVAYIIMWIAVPSSSVQVIGSSHKKLFRDISNKTIGGVCAGLASYFEVSIWVPKVVFILGAFLTIPLSTIFDGHFGGFFFPGVNGFFIMVYIILWIVVPPAVTASDRLSMKGEAVDLNNIKSSVQEDLQDGKKKVNNNKKEPVMVPTNGRSTLGDFIILLLKIFGYLIFGSILIGIVIGLFTAGVALFSIAPLKDYLIDGTWENVYAITAVILLVWLPIVAIIVWIIRKLMKARSSRGLTIAFVSLWLVGLVAGCLLLGSLYNNFKYVSDPITKQVAITNAHSEKLDLELERQRYSFRYRRSWLINNDIAGFLADSAHLNNTRIILRQAKSDSFTVAVTQISNGSSITDANNRASKILVHPIRQNDDHLIIPCYFNISKQTKFRNQFVLVTIGVPVGKKIEVHNPRGYGNRFFFQFGWDDFYDDDFMQMDDEYGNTNDLNWEFNKEYIMTQQGLEPTTPDVDARKDRIKSAQEIIEQQKEKIKDEKDRIKNSIKEKNKELQDQIDQQKAALGDELDKEQVTISTVSLHTTSDMDNPLLLIGKSLMKISWF